MRRALRWWRPPPIHLIKLPPGFVIELFADDLPDARSMALGDKGTLFVGTRTGGRVYAVVDADQDYKADRVVTIASGLFMPNGVAFRAGSLYVAEVNRILCYENIEDHLNTPGQPKIIANTLPDDEHHGWKFIRFGPDDKLYVPVGAPCNICAPDLPYAAIHRMNPDGSGYEPFATGWLQKGGGWGRPVDILVLADGSMLVSDDRKGAVYRIRYAGMGK